MWQNVFNYCIFCGFQFVFFLIINIAKVIYFSVNLENVSKKFLEVEWVGQRAHDFNCLSDITKLSFQSWQKCILLPACLFLHILIDMWHALLNQNIILTLPPNLLWSQVSTPISNTKVSTSPRWMFLGLYLLKNAMICVHDNLRPVSYGDAARLWFGHLVEACSCRDRLRQVVQPLRHLLSLWIHPQNGISRVLSFLVKLWLRVFQWWGEAQ